ncbi:unnamed protein product [marine sediment metagenome]|uniref:Uncharacterized protein n=1 Tax=marine sediment metagenome TaxID=412755 RepID=X1EX83_9ZZZZ
MGDGRLRFLDYLRNGDIIFGVGITMAILGIGMIIGMVIERCQLI